MWSQPCSIPPHGRPGKTDDLTKSIHYGEVSRFITEFMEQNTFQLLETAAERLAEELLLNTERLEKICLEIKKPWAPVGLPLETVSVEIERGWHTGLHRSWFQSGR